MKKSIGGFTLAELLTVIAIIWILVVGASRINFNPQIDKQKSLEFSNGLFTTIENIRNDSLYGKWVGTGWTIHPNYWVIELGTGSTFQVKYSTWGALQLDTWNSYTFPPYWVISSLKCNNLSNNLPESHTWAKIIIAGSQLSLSGCSNTSHKTLEIWTRFKAFTGSILLNTVTWVIERK